MQQFSAQMWNDSRRWIVGASLVQNRNISMNTLILHPNVKNAIKRVLIMEPFEKMVQIGDVGVNLVLNQNTTINLSTFKHNVRNVTIHAQSME